MEGIVKEITELGELGGKMKAYQEIMKFIKTELEKVENDFNEKGEKLGIIEKQHGRNQSVS